MNRQIRKGKKKRIPGLNSLRALAVLGVLFYHACPLVIKGGYFGVITFFVISGYLSAYGTIGQMREGKWSVLQHYKKRFLRIYPALVVVIFASIGALALIDIMRMVNTQEEVVSVLLGYNNFWQIRMQADYFANLTTTSPFTHFWYIAILIQFELVWPLIAGGYYLVRKRYGKLNAMSVFLTFTFLSFFVMPVAILIKHDISITVLYYNTFMRIFSLLAGAMAGMIKAEGLRISIFKFKSPLVTRILYILFFITTVLIYIFVDGASMPVYIFGMQLYTLAVCVMIDIIVQNRRHLRYMIDTKISKWLSTYSYEVYLWQYPVLFLTGILLKQGTWYTLAGQVILIFILSIWLHNMPKIIGSLIRPEKKDA